MTDERPNRAPIVLLVDDEEWRARSLESVFNPGGYAVLKVFTGRQAAEVVQRISPDVVIIDHHLPDMTGLETLIRIRESGRLRQNTPIFVLSSADLGRQECLEILRAGAWDVLRAPLDAEQFLLRIGTYVAAKHEGDRAMEESLFDPLLGCYNVKGLLRRADELAADAHRHHRHIACVAIGSGPTGPAGPSGTRGSGLRPVVDLLSSSIRTADALACIGEGEFVVIAPGTDPPGARRLAERILAAVDDAATRNRAVAEAESGPGKRPLWAGISTSGPEGPQEIVPVELLSRARSALRLAKDAPVDSGRIQLYGSNSGSLN